MHGPVFAARLDSSDQHADRNGICVWNAKELDTRRQKDHRQEEPQRAVRDRQRQPAREEHAGNRRHEQQCAQA